MLTNFAIELTALSLNMLPEHMDGQEELSVG